jgi:hypothetical protein
MYQQGAGPGWPTANASNSQQPAELQQQLPPGFSLPAGHHMAPRAAAAYATGQRPGVQQAPAATPFANQCRLCCHRCHRALRPSLPLPVTARPQHKPSSLSTTRSALLLLAQPPPDPCHAACRAAAPGRRPPLAVPCCRPAAGLPPGRSCSATPSQHGQASAAWPAADAFCLHGGHRCHAPCPWPHWHATASRAVPGRTISISSSAWPAAAS